LQNISNSFLILILYCVVLLCSLKSKKRIFKDCKLIFSSVVDDEFCYLFLIDIMLIGNLEIGELLDFVLYASHYIIIRKNKSMKIKNLSFL
jgi:hypothetical protein